MILGTMKMSLILGPINGHFWARGPRIYGFSYTKILQKTLESIWEHLGKYYFCIYENHNCRKLSTGEPTFFCLEFMFEYIFLSIYFQNNFVEMRIGK